MIKSNAESRVKKAQDSKSYKEAKSKAEEYANDPDQLNELLDKASNKANGKRGGLEAVWTQLMACFRLIRAYAKGTYRDIPWSSLVMLVASVIYFVMPVDLIPDFIAGLGLLDDAAILSWTVNALRSEINAFVEWESNNDS